MGILDQVDSPQELKLLTFAQLERLAVELRDEIVRTTSRTGGHVAPNLGVVELTRGGTIDLIDGAFRLLFELIVWLGLGALGLGLVHLLLVHRRRQKRLSMTAYETRQERRQLEGDRETRKRQRHLMRS